jgi:hypothetical protein
MPQKSTFPLQVKLEIQDKKSVSLFSIDFIVIRPFYNHLDSLFKYIKESFSLLELRKGF